jgi:hypothetical protein
MVERFHIAVIGAEPAGLSAAGRAAELDAKERKHVMDEPGFLDLRSDMRFAGTAHQVAGHF